MTRLPVNGLHYNVEIAGSGRPLVLLHGFTGSADTWQPFVERFRANHQVISIDLLGHGQSDSPSDPMRYRVERQIDDLTAVLEELKIDDYDLLGYSMGGRLALHLALAHGERVTGLILESASPGIEPAEERASRIQQDESLATMLEREGIDAFVKYWERLPLFASQMSLPAETRQRLRRQRLSSSKIGLAGSLRGFGAGVSEPLWDRLHELPPTLLIAGELDEKYANLARRMGNLIPDSTIAIVPGAGHTVHLEKPDEFADLVTGSLRSNTIVRTGAPRPPATHPGRVAPPCATARAVGSEPAVQAGNATGTDHDARETPGGTKTEGGVTPRRMATASQSRVACGGEHPGTATCARAGGAGAPTLRQGQVGEHVKPSPPDVTTHSI